jgi:hypothetical protein
MEHPVSMSLKHLGVGVEARVAEFGNLLGEEFDSVGGVAEDDGLIDLKLVIVRSCQLIGKTTGDLSPKSTLENSVFRQCTF